MTWRKLVMAAAVAAVAIPSAAMAHDHGRGHGRGHHKHERVYRYYDERPVYYRESYAPPRAYQRERYVEPRRAYRSCRSGGTTGLIVGGAAGALLGRELDGGRNRATGTILGAAAGGLLGREIDRKDRC
jgi:uncharacterized protein YcfJ